MASSVQRIKDFQKWLACQSLGPMANDDLSLLWEFAMNNPNNRMAKHVLILLRIEAYWRKRSNGFKQAARAAGTSGHSDLPAMQDFCVGSGEEADP